MTRHTGLYSQRLLVFLTICALFIAKPLLAEQSDQSTVGNVIQINTHLRSFVGKPSWLLLIRDLDHNQNIPYVYDIMRADNQWLAFTYGHHYLIVASTLQFTVYQPRTNTYRTYRIHNFCHLESQGRIQRDVGLSLWISGDVWPYDDGYHCNINRYPIGNFTIANPCDNE